MATDIAFALGFLSLFGRRAPLGLKVFLTAAAIADDLAAVVVIAVFYTEKIAWTWALAAVGTLAAIYVFTHVLRIRRLALLLILVAALWACMYASGIHATIAGVLLAMLIPVRSEIDPAEFLALADDRLKQLRAAELTRDSPVHDETQLEAIVDLRRACVKLEPDGLILEEYWHPVKVYFILPLFALANAGVAMDQSFLAAILSPVGLGVGLGLLIGKQLGVFGAAWLAVRAGWADLPPGVTWKQVYGAACLAGIGFTMSLFVAQLAFKDPLLIGQAKVGIITASLLSASWGMFVLSRTLPRAPEE